MSRERDPLPPAWEVWDDGSHHLLPTGHVKRPEPLSGLRRDLPSDRRVAEVYDAAGHLTALITTSDDDDVRFVYTPGLRAPTFILTRSVPAFQGAMGQGEGVFTAIGRLRSEVDLWCSECRKHRTLPAARAATKKPRRGRAARITL